MYIYIYRCYALLWVLSVAMRCYLLLVATDSNGKGKVYDRVCKVTKSVAARVLTSIATHSNGKHGYIEKVIKEESFTFWCDTSNLYLLCGIAISGWGVRV